MAPGFFLGAGGLPQPRNAVDAAIPAGTMKHRVGKWQQRKQHRCVQGRLDGVVWGTAREAEFRISTDVVNTSQTYRVNTSQVSRNGGWHGD